MKQSLLRRGLSLLLCLSILLGISVARPQRADAFALSASVVASVAAIMTACGVSYWAASQTDAIDYLGGKIDAYLGSLETVPVSYEDWLGISASSQLFEVVSGGVMRFGSGIANKVLDFVRWFNAEEGISSGGDPVSDAVGGIGFSPIYFPSNTVHSGDVSSTWVGTNLLRIDFANYSGSGGYLRFEGVVDQPGTYGFTVKQVSGVTTASFERVWLNLLKANGSSYKSSSCVFEPGYSASTGQIYQWQIEDYGPSFTFAIGFSLAGSMTPATGFCILELTGKPWYKAATNSFTPSDTVSVPEDVAEDDTFDVAPSVPLSSGMSVEDASDAIYDGITSEDGLTAEGESVEGAVSGWGWLSDILSSIHDFIAGIAQTVLGIPQAIGQAASDVVRGVVDGIQQVLIDVFVPDETFIGEFVASLYGTFDNRFSILSYPFSILGEFITRASGIGNPEPVLSWPNIIEPFSNRTIISSGSYNLNTIKSNSSFNNVYNLYMIIIKGYISFEFLTFLYLWFCDVFHMRENDYVSPLDDYGGDDE